MIHIYIEKYIEKYTKYKSEHCSKSKSNPDCVKLNDFVKDQLNRYCKNPKANAKHDCPYIKDIFCPLFPNNDECNKKVNF